MVHQCKANASSRTLLPTAAAYHGAHEHTATVLPAHACEAESRRAACAPQSWADAGSPAAASSVRRARKGQALSKADVSSRTLLPTIAAYHGSARAHGNRVHRRTLAGTDRAARGVLLSRGRMPGFPDTRGARLYASTVHAARSAHRTAAPPHVTPQSWADARSPLCHAVQDCIRAPCTQRAAHTSLLRRSMQPLSLGRMPSRAVRAPCTHVLLITGRVPGSVDFRGMAIRLSRTDEHW